MQKDVVYPRNAATVVIYIKLCSVCHQTIIFCKPEPQMFVQTVKIILSHVISGKELKTVKDGKVFFAFSYNTYVSVFPFRALPSLLS